MSIEGVGFEFDGQGRWLPSSEGLSEDQGRALDLDRHVVVVAGAGSGKTRTLCRRVVRVLGLWAWSRACGVAAPGAEALLVTTFTDKAAAELRARIRAELRTFTRALRDDPERWRRESALPAHRFGLLLAAYEQSIDELDHARIQTFHGLCAAILREHGARFGIDPGFTVLTGTEERRLKRDVVERVLRRMGTMGVPTKHPGWRRAEWEELLLAGLERRHDLGPTLAEIDGWDEGALLAWLIDGQEQRISAVLAGLEPGGALVAPLRALVDLAPEGAQPKAFPWGAAVLAAVAEAPSEPTARLERLSEIVDVLQGAVRADGEWKRAHHSWTGSKAVLGQSASAVAEAWSDVYGSLVRTFGSDPSSLTDLPGRAEVAAFALLPVVAQMVRLAVEDYEQRRMLGSFMDFTDLETRASNLVTRHAEVALALRSRHPFVFVDEFQDTNAAQWALVRAVLGLPEKKSGLFIVGDPKQAIYRFRGGDVSLFDTAREELKGIGVIEVPLAENHRSDPQILSVINGVFASLLPEDSPARPRWEAPFQALFPRRAASLGARVVRYEYGGPAPSGGGGDEDSDDGGDAPEEEGPPLDEAAIVARIAAAAVAVGPSKPGEIAILLRRRRFLPDYATALRDAGVPHQIAAGRGFFSRREVLDVADLLAALANGEDGIALLGALRGPFLALSDVALLALVHGRTGRRALVGAWSAVVEAASLEGDLGEVLPHAPAPLCDQIAAAARRFGRWLDLLREAPATVVLRRIFDDTGHWWFLHHCDPSGQSRANLEKLFEMASEVDVAVGGGVGALAARILEEAEDEDREGDANLEGDAPVYLMTIHQSKGLEFPHVILPDLVGAMQGPGTKVMTSGRRAVDGVPSAKIEPGLRVPVPGVDGPEARPTRVRRLLEQQANREELAEFRRLFYVAWTRAERSISLVLPPKPDKVPKRMSFAKLLWELPAEKWATIQAEDVPEAADAEGSLAERGVEDLGPRLGPVVADARPTVRASAFPAAAKAAWVAEAPSVGAPPTSAPNTLLDGEQRRILGILVHSCLEDGVFDDPERISLRVGAEARRRRWPVEVAAAVCEEVIRHVRRALDVCPDIASPDARLREVEFQLPWPEPALWLRGAIDRIHHDEKASNFVVFDFKTERAGAAVARAAHEAQLVLYLYAAASILPAVREGRATVSAALLLTGTGEVVEICPPSTLDEARRRLAPLIDAHLAASAGSTPPDAA